LKFQLYTRGQTSIVTEVIWAKVFTDAGILTVVHNDIESWLHTHVAVIVPMMTISSVAHSRQAGVSWTEAKTYARAMREGFALVQRLGDSLTPSSLKVLSHVPKLMVAAMFWVLSRLKLIRELGAQGTSEPRALIDMMIATDPIHTLALQSIRP
jgi:2-dehydropantoate 2-reductase